MIEVDIQKMVKNLQNTKKAKPENLSKGMLYLKKNVYSTLMAGDPLTIGDIDFKKFTQEECHDFSYYVRTTLHEKIGKVERIRNFFGEYIPKTISRRTFF